MLNCELSIADCEPPSYFWPPLSAFCLLPTAYCLLVTGDRLLLTADCPLGVMSDAAIGARPVDPPARASHFDPE
jgi:hypothetical protein